MIRTKPLSIFIDHSGDETLLLGELAELLGQSLKREDPDVGPIHRGRVVDTELTLVGDHGLDDDCGIEFSRYEYQLALTAFDVGLRMASFAAMYKTLAPFLAEKLSARLRCRTIVVENLQREVVAFEP